MELSWTFLPVLYSSKLAPFSTLMCPPRYRTIEVKVKRIKVRTSKLKRTTPRKKVRMVWADRLNVLTDLEFKQRYQLTKKLFS